MVLLSSCCNVEVEGQQHNCSAVVFGLNSIANSLFTLRKDQNVPCRSLYCLARSRSMSEVKVKDVEMQNCFFGSNSITYGLNHTVPIPGTGMLTLQILLFTSDSFFYDNNVQDMVCNPLAM